VKEWMVVEAREMASSRIVMHKIGDKSEMEYREQIGDQFEGYLFVEDEETGAEVAGAVTDVYDEAWYEAEIARMSERHQLENGGSD
jgi:hypothetical protein